jgi:hypothetical protein
VTVPVPEPAFVTLSVNAGWKVAVTPRAPLIVTTHEPVPVQSPDQPVKTEPAEGEAVSVTVAPSPRDALHVAPHAMPPMSDVTVPVPVPAFVTVSVWRSPNVAETLRAWLMVTMQVVLEPEQSPVQPAKPEPELAAAVSVTRVPLEYVALHVAPQLTPPTSDVTVPAPVPVVATSSG